MKRFIETIQVIDGTARRLELHQRRMDATVAEAFGVARGPRLEEVMAEVPERGMVKCRVIYGRSGVEGVECQPYTPRVLRRLRVVDGGDIDYHLKSEDRSELERLRAMRGDCDDVLIERGGLITDISYANVLLVRSGRLYTPRRPLLRGTRVASLVSAGLVTEVDIPTDGLCRYESLMVVNAMLGPDDTPPIAMADIRI